MNELYNKTVDDKAFEEWAKEMKGLIPNQLNLDHFNQGYAELAEGANYLARASFVCYWEISMNNSLARLAPAITQATLIHMMHRFIEQEQIEEAQVVSQLMINFLRLLQALGGANNEEE